jgi:hypothetical protein
MDYIEMIKAALFLVASLQALANKTDAEVDGMLVEERKRFAENKPENLPDPA